LAVLLLPCCCPVGVCCRLLYSVWQVDEDHDSFDSVLSDAEASILLLRHKLFPDPAAAAAAAATAKQTRHAKRSKSAAGPSKATVAAIAAATAAAAAAKQLPPVVLKTVVYTVLTDRTTADRDLEDLRQQGRVRVFKLAIGAAMSERSLVQPSGWGVVEWGAHI